MRFAVVGDPVSHSRSPAIHAAAFAALDIDATYEAISVRSGGFDRVVDHLRSGDLDGVNVTMPLKGEAAHAVDERSLEASRSEAVNTVIVRSGMLWGENTDVDGVRHAIGLLELEEHPVVLILGGGGAARAACVALEDRELVVSTRRREAAPEVLEQVGLPVRTIPWGTPVDGAVVVNATPLGMHGEHLPRPVLEAASGLVDMVYGAEASPAVRWARASGRPVADGLDMLVGQAARAFEIFVERPAPIDVMASAARG